jgi:hypothetical protein
VILKAILLALSLTAQAAPSYEIPPEQTPLRQARVRGTISKYVVTNGSYLDPVEKICDFESMVPVYGTLEKGKSARHPTVAQCASVARGKPQKVQLMASVKYFEPADGMPAQKHLSTTLFVYEGGEDGPNNYLSQVGGAGADPGARTISLVLHGTSYESLGLPEKVETFSVRITAIDENQ